MKRRKVPNDGQNESCAELLTSLERKRSEDSSRSRQHQVFMEGHLPSQPVAIAALRGNAYL